jgi:hypothetical protein
MGYVKQKNNALNYYNMWIKQIHFLHNKNIVKI